MAYSFKYGSTRVRDFQAVLKEDEHSGKVELAAIKVGDDQTMPTERFWRSFFTRFGISDNVFKYFDYHEVFQRISERIPDDRVRYCVERDGNNRLKLLAVSNPARPVAHPSELRTLIERYSGLAVSYDEGIITSTHVPRSGEGTFSIGPDRFKHRFVLETPVDGFGNPRIYLSLLRLVCANGMIGYAPTFRSEIRVGKEVTYSIARALDSYDNGEGYAALRQRFESAQSSWASINEANRLYRTLVKLRSAGSLTPTVLNDFYQVTGNLNELYGLANLDTLSVKRQRVLPARCRVYDLLNFTSELATHHADPWASRGLQAHIGQLISDEYDMEGTAEKIDDFREFFVAPDDNSPPMSLN
jgi:hypothetical protein